MAKKKFVTEKLRKLIIEAILDKKGNDVVSLDLQTIKDTSSDYFIITHGDSGTQVRAICNHVIDEVAKDGFTPYHTEGIKNAEWIIVDFVDVVVHIFYREKREFYALEELWNDAKLSKHNSI